MRFVCWVFVWLVCLFVKCENDECWHHIESTRHPYFPIEMEDVFCWFSYLVVLCVVALFSFRFSISNSIFRLSIHSIQSQFGHLKNKERKSKAAAGNICFSWMIPKKWNETTKRIKSTQRENRLSSFFRKYCKQKLWFIDKAWMNENNDDKYMLSSRPRLS